MCDQGESKMATRDREPIWAWEFYPIIVPLMEMLLMFHPTFHKTSPVFHHIFPLMPIKIHIIFQFSIHPFKFIKPLKCCFNRNGCLAETLSCKDSLHL